MSSSNRKRRGLGQGLGALIPGSPDSSEEQHREPATSPSRETPQTERGYREVLVNSILPNPYQPRSIMEQTRLEELAASIREHGIIQPLIVTQIEDGAIGERFRLIAGERRWRAAKLAGLNEVPVVVKEATEREMLEMAIIENIQRADLNPLEEAAAYQQMAEFSDMTQFEIADRVGKSRTAVTNTMRLLKLPEPVQDLLRQGLLTEGHARTLLGLPSASLMMEVAETVIKRGMTVRQVEDLVKRYNSEGGSESTRAPRLLSVHDRDLQKQFVSVLGTNVELKRGRKGGQIVIHFENDEDLQSIYDRFIAE